LDSRKNSYAYYNGEVYKALVPSGGAVGAKRPDINPTYWQIGDVCGKLLESCRIRYHATFYRPGSSRNYLAGGMVVTTTDGKYHGASAAFYNTEVVLPFGGFPGTRRLR
jgi:hypothetical protein